MKIVNIVMRILLALVLLPPVLGVLGVFPPPTEDMFSPAGWIFMQALMNSGYMMPLIGLLCAVCLILVVFGRTALAAVLLAPFTVNVICYHVFVEHNLLSPASLLAWVLLITNAYFLWVHWGRYQNLFVK